MGPHWLWAAHACEDTQPGIKDGSDDDVPYDDSKDHDPCPDCNRDGKSPNAGWYCPFVGPRMKCDTCDGAGWV